MRPSTFSAAHGAPSARAITSSVIPGHAEGVSPEPTFKLDAGYPVMGSGLDLRSPRNDGEVVLTAGDAHVAADGGAVATAIDDEVVAARLARDRLHDGLLDALVALRQAQGRAEIGSVLLA
jgi:hypothetical protein